jgi:hypothetical protein
MDLLNLMQLGVFRAGLTASVTLNLTLLLFYRNPFSLTDPPITRIQFFANTLCLLSLAANALREFRDVLIVYRHHLFIRLPWRQVDGESRVYFEHARR